MHTDKVAVLEVEAVELVAGLLRVHYVFIDDEGGALGVGGNALSHLAGAWLASVPSHTRRGAPWDKAYRMGPNLPKSSKRSSGVTL